MPNAIFAEFSLDLQTGELRRGDGEAIRLVGQPFQILLALLERPGELVPREELQRRLWPNDTVVEFEHSISAAMNRLRTAIGDSAEKPRIVETLARKGYRLKVDVQWEDRAESAVGADGHQNGTLLGKRISHYRVLSILGGGGMGVVYRAEDIRLSRAVALKFLPDELSNDPAAAQRLAREARAASALNHPNICTVYDVGEFEGRPFIAMEYLEGRTLRDLIANPPTSSSTAGLSPVDTQTLLDISSQVLSALAAAHAKGIIHRDLKPANIFVETNGRARILDFGIAKNGEVDLSSETLSNPKLAHLPDLTRTGVASGTVGYMSPEQLRCEQLDFRTDVFSFGLILYEMLTGIRAFSGATAADVRNAVLEQEPESIRQRNPNASPALGRIVTRTLEKDREKRYQNVEDLQADLRKIETRPKAVSKYFWLIVIAFLLFAASLLWFISQRRSTAHVWKQRQLTAQTSENPVTGGAISPDGKKLLYTDLHGIYVKPIDGGQPLPINVPAAYQSLHPTWEIGNWLPDSTHFYAIAELPPKPSTLWLFSTEKGAERRIAEGVAPWGVSPNGEFVALTQDNDREIWTVNTKDGTQTKIFTAGPNDRLRAVQWSPNGQNLAFIRNNASPSGKNASQIELVSHSGGAPQVLLSGSAIQDLNDLEEGFQDMKWLPDGRLIYVGGEPAIHGVSCNLWSTTVGASARASTPERLTNWAGFCVNDFSITADGRKLVFSRSSQISDMYVSEWNRAAQRITPPNRLTSSDDLSLPIGWTEDGKGLWIASNRDGAWGLYRQQLDSRDAKPVIVGLVGLAFAPAISPDHRWLLYSGSNDATSDGTVMRVPVEGGPSAQSFPIHFGGLQCGQHQSAGCVIAERPQGSGLLVFTAVDAVAGRGQELARVNDARAADLQWAVAPDCSRIALFAPYDDDIRILDLQDQSWTEISSDGAPHIRTLAWDAKANGLFAASATNDSVRLLHIDLQGNATPLWETKGDNTLLRVTPSPDGTKFAIHTVSRVANLWMVENF
jgi:eukaryotic-like serine/threonine-protein kinase